MFSKLKNGISAMIKQGVTRRRICLCIALSMTISVIPFFFLPTLFCLLAAAILRLNQPIMHTVNHLAGPAQILLFLPFMRLGEGVLGLERYPLDMAQLRLILRSGFPEVLTQLCLPIARAMTGWLVVAPVIFLAGYAILHAGTRGAARPRSR